MKIRLCETGYFGGGYDLAYCQLEELRIIEAGQKGDAEFCFTFRAAHSPV